MLKLQVTQDSGTTKMCNAPMPDAPDFPASPGVPDEFKEPDSIQKVAE